MAEKKPLQKQEYASKEERLAALRAKGRALNNKLGIEGIKVASDLAAWKRASFGIKELDDLIGGGIPHGNFTTIWGPPGCGKTSSAFRLVAEAQANGKIVYWIALEPFDALRAKKFGVKLDELIIGQFPQAEQSLDTIIDYSRNKLVDVIILDSIHSLSPHGEQENSKGEKSIADDTMALLARKLSQFFRQAIDPIKRAEVAVLLIGQTRLNVGFIAIEALTGGNALHHYSKLIIKQRRGAKDDAPYENKQVGDKKEKVLVGFQSIYKLDKVQVPDSKPEGSTVSIPYYFESGFELPAEVLKENEEIELAQLTEPHNIKPVMDKVSSTEPLKKKGRPKKV